MNQLDPYSARFHAILLNEFNSPSNAPFQFDDKVRNSSDDGVAELFPGKKREWLTKEFSKWKNKVLFQKQTFNPTLRNLYLFCTLVSATPNSVLYPPERQIELNRIEYLTEDSLKKLIVSLQNIDSLENDYILPVINCPEKMTTAFMVIFSSKVEGNSRIYVQFQISYYLGLDDCSFDSDATSLGGISSSPIGPAVAVTDNNDVIELFEKAYNKMKQEVEQSSGIDYLTEELGFFYDTFSEWSHALSPSSDLLVKYFPVLPVPEADKNGSRSGIDSIIASATQGRQR